MSFHIQRVFAEDAKLVTEISRKTFYDTFHKDNTAEDMQLFLDTYFTEENIAAELNRSNNICYVAFLDNEPAGYVNLREKSHALLNNENALEIGRIYVHQQHIGAGVGKALMERSLHTAELLEKEVIWLGVWEHNPRAIEFYRKWKFEKFGEHAFILGHDVQNDWLMKRAVRL